MKEDFIHRKERWAKKMSGRERPTRPNAGRLPPGQHEVNNFPVLDLGVHPEIPLDEWQLKIHGEVENPVTLKWEQFMALPQFTDVSDFTASPPVASSTWSSRAWHFSRWQNWSSQAKREPSFFTGYDDYTTNTTLDDCMDDDVMVAHSWNGQPLTLEHGGPARMVIPKLYAWKGAKFIREIEFAITTSSASRNSAATRTPLTRSLRTGFPELAKRASGQ